jgi:hypothetical protein
MIILGIDPGTTETAWARYDSRTMQVLDAAKETNDIVQQRMNTLEYDVMGIEMMACYGMATGKTVLVTCVWIGKFERDAQLRGKPYFELYRKQDMCMHLCHTTRAKDTNIRQALMDRYSPDPIGNKKSPGPLYHIKKDMWSALAIAITCAETKVNK